MGVSKSILQRRNDAEVTEEKQGNNMRDDERCVCGAVFSVTACCDTHTHTHTHTHTERERD